MVLAIYSLTEETSVIPAPNTKQLLHKVNTVNKVTWLYKKFPVKTTHKYISVFSVGGNNLSTIVRLFRLARYAKFLNWS